MKVIETQRLVLREFSVADADALFLLNSDPDVIKYTGDPAFRNVAEARSFLEHYTPYKTYGYGRWAVIDKENGSFLGWCGLKYDPATDENDIGFRFYKKHWNKGIATEAAKACLKIGFEKFGMQKIIGRAMKENTASIKVLEKIGMVYWKDFEFHHGHGGCIYTINKNS